ncbi:RagB/SusD domain-containing protein [Flavobacterium fryxellicola]|nr:RagB/SusD family nutrient uptake outer membrane protein [Flavobacterium fryxellicola]SHN79637.1 RagB/SusD domain-containing protein [Flavobacterium fryxellicola]
MKPIFNPKSILFKIQKKCIPVIFMGYCLACITLLSACDNFVETDQPSSQLSTPVVFESPTTATAAMVAIYAQLRSSTLLTGSPLGLSNQMGHYADELTFYGDSENSTSGFYTNSVLASNEAVATLWTSSYRVVYNTNAMLEGIAASSSLSLDKANQLTGEALFVRALVHFYLVNLYGEIPYITTTDYRQNRVASRLPVAKVYELIIADLNKAYSLLPENEESGERVRPNQYTAQALLARVYLFDEKWDEASNAASALLNNTATYALQDDLNTVFLNTSSSTIWQFSPFFYGSATEEGNLFIFTAGPPPFTALSDALLNSFEPMDQRKISWTTAVSDGNMTWYYASKYKDNSSVSFSSEYSVVFRLEEQYLIRAEARTRAGDLIGAKEDLNIIRNRAGLPNTTAISQDELLNAVLKERRVELFTEHGHRFFDLKRYGKLDSALSNKIGWNTTDALFPIPETELLLNPNLSPQNLGY